MSTSSSSSTRKTQIFDSERVQSSLTMWYDLITMKISNFSALCVHDSTAERREVKRAKTRARRRVSKIVCYEALRMLDLDEVDEHADAHPKGYWS